MREFEMQIRENKTQFSEKRIHLYLYLREIVKVVLQVDTRRNEHLVLLQWESEGEN